MFILTSLLIFLSLVNAEAPFPLTLGDTLLRQLHESHAINWLLPPRDESPKKNPHALILVRCQHGEYPDGTCRGYCEWGQNDYGGCLTYLEYCNIWCELNKNRVQFGGYREIWDYPFSLGFSDVQLEITIDEKVIRDFEDALLRRSDQDLEDVMECLAWEYPGRLRPSIGLNGWLDEGCVEIPGDLSIGLGWNDTDYGNFILEFAQSKMSDKKTEPVLKKARLVTLEYPEVDVRDFEEMTNLELLKEANRFLMFTDDVLLAIQSKFVWDDMTDEQKVLARSIIRIQREAAEVKNGDLKVYVNAYKND